MAERRQQMVVDRGGRPVRAAISSFCTNWCQQKRWLWHNMVCTADLVKIEPKTLLLLMTFGVQLVCK